MGLKERRELQSFVESHYPALKNEIDEAAKFNVDVEVKWDTLAVEGMSHMYLEHWPNLYFKPLVEAFKGITADDMGAQALKDSLKKIVIENEGSKSNEYEWCTFEEGVLRLNHEPHTNNEGYSGKTRLESLVTLLENSL
jgi:hypothetical protein